MRFYLKVEVCLKTYIYAAVTVSMAPLGCCKVRCCGCCPPELGRLTRRVGKATARGRFSLAKRRFPSRRNSGGWPSRFEVGCPGQKWQSLSERRALIMRNDSTDLQQIFFKKLWGNEEIKKFPLNLSLEVFGVRIIFVCVWMFFEC